MAFIDWTDEFSTQIAEIDAQHKYLIQLINEYHQNVSEGVSINKMADTIEALLDYTLFHFTYEEKLLDKYHFPQTTEHKHGHQRLIHRLLKFKKELTNFKPIDSIAFLDFLSTWISNHILHDDIAYAEFLQGCGEK